MSKTWYGELVARLSVIVTHIKPAPYQGRRFGATRQRQKVRVKNADLSMDVLIPYKHQPVNVD